MESNIQRLLQNFDAYLKYSKTIFENDGSTDITYSFWSYDLIDEDLDFDEYYYVRVLEQFNGFLEDLVKQHVNITQASAIINKNKCITRHEDIFESKIEYTYIDDSTVQCTKTNFIKI